MVDSKIELKMFPMDEMAYDSVIVMIAKRNSGKSFLCRDILANFRKLPAGVVISATERKSPFFSTFMPNEFIFDEFEPSIVSNVYERQEKLIQKFGKDYKKFDSRCFILMDDCIADKRFFKDKGVRDIFMNGRHSNLMYMLTTQDCMAIPADLRGNIDYVFILRETRVNILKKIYDHYASVIPDFEMFRYMMKVFTENYGVLVINNKAQSNKLEDQVFYYKAKDHQNLKVCSGKAWNFHEQYYNSNYLVDCNDVIEPYYDKKHKKVVKIVKAED